MDLLGPQAVAAVSGAGGVEAKRKRVEGGAKQEESLLTLVAKLCLSSAQTTRVLLGLSCEALKVRIQNPYVSAMLQATKSYAETCKKLKGQQVAQEKIREDLGLPCVHAYNALVKTYLATGPVGKDELQVAVQGWKALGGWKYIHASVPLCKLGKMYDQTSKKLLIKVIDVEQPTDLKLYQPCHFWKLIKPCLLQDPQCRELLGAAPPGDLERRIQEILDETE